jgi:hypothetical protein
LRGCRKGHRTAIKKVLGDACFRTFVVDRQSPSYELHEEYRRLHHKCAGRVTRPKETFDQQYEKLLAGHAILVGLEYKEVRIAMSYFEHCHDKALYASGADDPLFNRLPLYHVMVFAAMEYYKRHDVRFLTMEQPVSPSAQYDYYPDDKQLNIALFKRGFPGRFMSCYRGVKYLADDLFLREADRFKERYWAGLRKKVAGPEA